MHTFKLADAEGEIHSYEVTPHRNRDGRKIVAELAALLAPPLAGVAGAFVDGAGGESALDGGALVGVGAALRDVLRDVPDDLVERLLANTVRDSVPLNTADARDKAYSRNYREEERALVEVIRYNRFFTLPAGIESGSSKVGAALAELARAALDRAAQRLANGPAATEPDENSDGTAA